MANPPSSLNSLITVSQNGVDVKNATGAQVLFSSQNPFAKLDKTNNVSFQNISILFNTDPPNAAGAGLVQATTIYSFKHGYTYVPSTWFLMQHVGGDTGQQNPAYQQEGGTVHAVNISTVAAMTMTVDTANVNLIVQKTTDGVNNADCRGISLNIRVYVFAGDLTGTTNGS